MLHLFQCRYTKPFWHEVKHFLESVLEVKGIRRIDELLVFNTIKGNLISEEACAFVRHAFGHFYRDFAMVDTHNIKFTWQYTYNRTIQSYRNAVLTYAYSIKKFIANRKYTKQKKRVPLTALTQYNKLIDFSGGGMNFDLTTKFKSKIEQANKNDSDLRKQQQQ